MTPTLPLHVAVFGVGAVGGYFGGTLARAGHEVTFIACGDTAAALRQRGLRVDSVAGGFLVGPAQVVEDPADVGPGRVSVRHSACRALRGDAGGAVEGWRGVGSSTFLVGPPMSQGISQKAEAGGEAGGAVSALSSVDRGGS